MFDGNRVVALVPARAGSKGIPGKNLRALAGRSLLGWSIDLALSVGEIDDCVVSTDGAQLASEAQRLGARVHRRSAELATDDSLVIDAIRDFLDAERRAGSPVAILVLLEPTSPFRTVGDVRGCLDALRGGADSVATFAPAEPHPNRLFRIDEDMAVPFIDGAVPWEPRQRQHPRAFQLTGGVYAFWVARLPSSGRAILFGDVRPVVVPRSRCIDLDEPLDLEVADVLLRRGAIPDVELPDAP